MVPKPTYEELKKENLQLKKAVAKLKADSEKYQAIFNHNLNCIYMHDLSCNFLDANNAALSLMGYSRKEIPELNLSSLIDADQLPAAASAIEEIVKIGFQKRLTEYKVKKKDGSCGWVETESTLICQQGKPFVIHGDQLLKFNERCITKKIANCRAKTALKTSRSVNLRRKADLATKKMIFFTTNENKLISEMVDQEFGEKHYKVDYYLNKRFGEMVK